MKPAAAHNEDRHLDNFIARSSASGWVLLAMDFSRAWTIHGFPPPPLPMPSSTNTIFWHRELKSLIGDFVDLAAIDEFLTRLSAIRVPTVEGIIERHPPEWITPNMRRDVLDWWGSSARTNRIDEIRKGIHDASYL